MKKRSKGDAYFFGLKVKTRRGFKTCTHVYAKKRTHKPFQVRGLLKNKWFASNNVWSARRKQKQPRRAFEKEQTTTKMTHFG